MGGQSHAPAALPQGMTRDPLCMRLGGAPTRFRTPDRPDCCESLYRLSYPDFTQLWIVNLYTSYIIGQLNKYSAYAEVMEFGLGQRRG